MYVVGIDLSGPSNTDDTSVVGFQAQGSELFIQKYISHGTDEAIFELIKELSSGSEVVIGIDAPLSYNMGGGDRPADKKLRKRIIDVGMHPGSIMPPTMSRMAYLTLRGITIARLLESIGKSSIIKIVEVHPGATLVLRGAELEQVLDLKKDSQAREKLLEWLQGQGMEGIVSGREPSDHYVAACSSALAAWRWNLGESVWLERASYPYHPYDYAC